MNSPNSGRRSVSSRPEGNATGTRPGCRARPRGVRRACCQDASSLVAASEPASPIAVPGDSDRGAAFVRISGTPPYPVPCNGRGRDGRHAPQHGPSGRAFTQERGYDGVQQPREHPPRGGCAWNPMKESGPAPPDVDGRTAPRSVGTTSGKRDDAARGSGWPEQPPVVTAATPRATTPTQRGTEPKITWCSLALVAYHKRSDE